MAVLERKGTLVSQIITIDCDLDHCHNHHKKQQQVEPNKCNLYISALVLSFVFLRIVEVRNYCYPRNVYFSVFVWEMNYSVTFTSDNFNLTILRDLPEF